MSNLCKRTTQSLWLSAFLLVLLVAAPALSGIFRQDLAASPFASLSRDYFARFVLDPDAVPAENETSILLTWRIAIAENADSVTVLMAGHLADFLRETMGLDLPVVKRSPAVLPTETRAIVLMETGGGEAEISGSFTISTVEDRITICGQDIPGLRDGIVVLVDSIGFREAPILKRGEQVYRPRLETRIGFRPALGPMRDVVFHGYNGITSGMTDLYKLSSSQCIPELVKLQDAEYRERVFLERQEAHRLGLKNLLLCAYDDQVFR